VGGRRVRFLVSGKTVTGDVNAGWNHFVIKSVLDHEVMVIV
jgi:hypothetical protein